MFKAQTLIVIVLSGGLLFPAGLFAAQEEKVIISYSSRDFAFLPAHVAAAKGFFREENIEPIMVQMRPPVAAPALINGEIHYTTTFGSTLNGILQGIPARMLTVITEKPPYYIVARPGIKSVAELRGKKIAAQPRGLSDRIAAEAILEAKGIDLKDVQFVNISGDLPVRMSVLTSGLADAVCLLPPGPVLLEKDGYRIIAGPNDIKIGSPTMGLTATLQRLSEKRSEAKRVIRALVRGLRFVRERRDDTVAIMAQWLGQKPDVANKSYDLIVPGFSQDGAISDATWQAIIDQRVQTLNLPRPASLDQVRDFALLREVQKELKLH
ncbi:MAG TPA: ABC transporter substrate-binding protein [Acidobacteriota bacterium]|nr:ABC transporter substrate-binding protein [Acidobacteriota bacterium]